MIKKIFLTLVVLIALLLGYAATRPDAFRVERSTVIQAPPEKVFPLINDFHNWGVWSPWEKLDPAMTRTHSGAASGKGAAYTWEGDKKVGAGKMEITDATAPSKVVVKLDFLKPFEGHDTAEFTLVPQAGGTQVTWAMYGPANFMSKLVGVFCSMDKMIGKDFDAGLSSMKTAAEAPAPAKKS